MNILKKANEIIFERAEEKQREYGPMENSLRDTAAVASILCKKEFTTEDAYKFLIALKVSRMGYNTKKDTMLDAVAYIAALDDLKNGGYDDEQNNSKK